MVELAKLKCVSGKVHFLGVRNDVPALLNDSYASVLPSLAEPLGNAVLEAMAMKKAVIGTNVDGIPEMIVRGSTGAPGAAGRLSRTRLFVKHRTGQPRISCRHGCKKPGKGSRINSSSTGEC